MTLFGPGVMYIATEKPISEGRNPVIVSFRQNEQAAARAFRTTLHGGPVSGAVARHQASGTRFRRAGTAAIGRLPVHPGLQDALGRRRGCVVGGGVADR